MKHTKLKICTLLLFGIGITSLQAQTVVTTIGGDATGAGGSANYTIGQVFYTTATGTGGEVIQGVQQPFEISVETGIEQKGINLECVVYPNPVTDYLTLEIDDDFEELFYQLFDTKGQMMETEKVVTSQTKIKTDKLTQGNYLLRVIENKKAIKTFKIIKN
jgi:hypothetical protein